MSLPALPVLSRDASPDTEALWLYLAKVKDAIDNDLPASMQAAVEVGALGYSPLSALAGITLPLVPGAPGTPTGLTATPFYRQIGLSWDLEVNPTITGWTVQRADDAAFTVNVTTRTSAFALSFLDRDLLDLTTYYYRIRAVATDGTASPWTAVVSATTLADTTTVLDQLQSAVLYLQRAHITNAVISSAQIDAAAIAEASIADASIGTAKIIDGAITTAKIGDLAVTNAKIDTLAVTDAKISTVSADKITAGTLNVLLRLTNDRITLDGTNSQISIQDGNDQIRVLLGQLGVGLTDYGLTLFDQDGTVMWDAQAQGATNAGIAAQAVATQQLALQAVQTAQIGVQAVDSTRRSLLTYGSVLGLTVPANDAIIVVFTHNLNVNPLVMVYSSTVSGSHAIYRFLTFSHFDVTNTIYKVRVANSDSSNITGVNLFVGFW